MPRPFDLLGFTLLAIAIGTFQLMLDRGEQVDWFGSKEIIVEAVGGRRRRRDVRDAHAVERPSVPAARPVPRPQPDAGHHLHGHHRPADDRDRDPVAALPAAAQGLSGLHHRHRHGAARHRHDDLDVHGVAPDRQGRRALADRDRAQPVRPVALRHDAVHARRQRGARSSGTASCRASGSGWCSRRSPRSPSPPCPPASAPRARR